MYTPWLQSLVCCAVWAGAAMIAAAPALAAGEEASTAGWTQLDQYTAQVMQDWDVPGLSLAVVQDGQYVHGQGYGLAELDSNRPVTPATLFPIASCTKAFTACLCAMAVDDGMLTWDTPLQSIVPGFSLADGFAGSHASLRDLLVQRSGLARHDAIWFTADLDSAGLLQRAGQLPPVLEFRQSFVYSSINYVLAAAVLEQLGFAGWEEQLQQCILKPLGMAHTCVSLEQMRKSPDYAVSYVPAAGRQGRMQPLDLIELPALRPAGGIISSADDMARWLQFMLDPGADNAGCRLGAAQAAFLRNPHSIVPLPPAPDNPTATAYTAGWYASTINGHYALSHDGVLYGYSAFVLLFPFDNCGCAVMCNARLSPAPELVAQAAADRLLGVGPRDMNAQLVAQREQQLAAERAAAAGQAPASSPQPVPAALRPLADYCGTYTHPGYGGLVVEPGPGGLSWRLGMLGGELQSAGGDAFVLLLNARSLTTLVGGLHGTPVEFGADAAGTVRTLRAALEPSLPPLEFSRENPAD